MRLPKLEEGWSTFFILWAMMLIAAAAPVQANITDGLQIMPFIATLGLFAGLLLAKSEFNDTTALVFSLVYGLFVVFVMVGLILPGDLSWRERALDIVARQLAWFEKAITGGTSRDGLIFVIQTAVIFWLLGYTAAWYTFRRLRIWRVIIPTGIVLLSVVYYYNGPRPLALYLAAYALLSMLFIVRTHVATQEADWRSHAVRYERGIWFDFLRAGLIASVFILFLSWSIPSLSASPTMGDAMSAARRPWREFQDNWTRLFSSLRSYGSATADPYQDTLVLGGPRTVGSTPVMDVRVKERLPFVYWQALAYDTYMDGGWKASETSETRLRFPEDGQLEIADTLARIPVEQTVINYIPNSSFIYGAPQIVSSDRQVFVDTNYDAQGNALVQSLRSRYVLRQGDEYTVTSQVSAVDAQSLRNASTSYPQWVTDTYLQISDTVTPETIALAEELTAEYTNNFDKAISVRNYLRSAIAYNDQIAAPPEGVDPVHYTLFVSREGYCNYYASAMAVMLRSQGIPARVVSGYAQGEFDEATLTYRVRASNAHTWTEVYFPGFGWIQFEPTASIPVVERPESLGGDAFGDATLEDETDFPVLGDQDRPQLEDERLEDLLGEDAVADSGGFFLTNGTFPLIPALIATAVLLLAGLVLWLAARHNRRVEADVSGSYGRLGTWGRWLGMAFQASDTPYERADRLSTAVPEGRTPIRQLTQQYVKTQFSPEHAADQDFDTQAEWRELRPLFLRKSLAQRWQRFQQRFSRKK